MVSSFDWRRNWSCFRAVSAGHFADLEPREPLDTDVFAEFADGARHHLADRRALVLDVVLFIEAVLFVELFHLAGHDLFDDGLRLSSCHSLCTINLAFLLPRLRRLLVAPTVLPLRRRE